MEEESKEHLLDNSDDIRNAKEEELAHASLIRGVELDLTNLLNTHLPEMEQLSEEELEQENSQISHYHQHNRTSSSSSSSSSFSSSSSSHIHSLERLFDSANAEYRSVNKENHVHTMRYDKNNNNTGEDETVDDVWVEMGVGGLKDELRLLFRRVFLDRLPSLLPLTQSLKIQHVRGVILHGPPGNGKTLIARGLAKLLGPETHLTILTATDILSKYVGETEKNLRDLFNDKLKTYNNNDNDNDNNDDTDDDNEEEDEDEDDLHKYSFENYQASQKNGGINHKKLNEILKDMFEGEFDSEVFIATELKHPSKSRGPDQERGKYSSLSFSEENNKYTEHSVNIKEQPMQLLPLRVIVIDEFDALFHRRGVLSDEIAAKAVFDGVTNTLLALMDGMYYRNDLLVIGLTNRLHAIDPALLRPGRFEVVIEIPSPEHDAREEIFILHTATLREQNMLAGNVKFDELAKYSVGFSGADIAGTVRTAISYALFRFHQESEQQTNHVNTTIYTNVNDNIKNNNNDKNNINSISSHDNTSLMRYRSFQVTRDDFGRAIHDIRSSQANSALLHYIPNDFDLLEWNAPESPNVERSNENNAEYINREQDAAYTTLSYRLSYWHQRSLADKQLTPLMDHDGTINLQITHAQRLIERVMRSAQTNSIVIAITGAEGSGKTSLARCVASLHPFRTIRYLNARQLIDVTHNGEELTLLREALSETSHSLQGLVVIDDFDLLLSAVAHTPHGERIARNLLETFIHQPHGVTRGESSAAIYPQTHSVHLMKKHTTINNSNNLNSNVTFVATNNNSSSSSSSSSLLLLNKEPTLPFASSSPHRVLIVTATDPAALTRVQRDLLLRVHRVHRSGVRTLLSSLKIMLNDHRQWASYVAQSYPGTMSYRTFVRITDMALQKIRPRIMEHHDQEQLHTSEQLKHETTAGAGASAGASANDNTHKSNISSTNTLKKTNVNNAHDTISRLSSSVIYLLNNEQDVRAFSEAVREVTVEMGLIDPFQA